jgi:hypothetical protein
MGGSPCREFILKDERGGVLTVREWRARENSCQATVREFLKPFDIFWIVRGETQEFFKTVSIPGKETGKIFRMIQQVSNPVISNKVI